MSETLELVKLLVQAGDYRASAHGVSELQKDELLIGDIIDSVSSAAVVEDYPDFHYGPTVLVLQTLADGVPVHVLWGVPKDHRRPAVLVTAYCPDPGKWSDDLMRRRQ